MASNYLRREVGEEAGMSHRIKGGDLRQIHFSAIMIPASYFLLGYAGKLNFWGRNLESRKYKIVDKSRNCPAVRPLNKYSVDFDRLILPFCAQTHTEKSMEAHRHWLCFWKFSITICWNKCLITQKGEGKIKVVGIF